MTRTLAPRWLTGLLAATITAFGCLAFFASARSEAAYTTGKCLGDAAQGIGASFAIAAHAAWKLNFENAFCLSAGSAPQVTYNGAGSGAGREAMGERRGGNTTGANSRVNAARFGMTDEPPSSTGQNQMNTGADATGDEGLIHVVPAAVGAVAVTVNFPNGCDRSLLPAGNETAPGASDFTNRIRFTKSQFNDAWRGDALKDHWHEVFPELAADTECQVPIKRVVRFDDSGTSFAFKDFLDKLAPGTWRPAFVTPDTRTWPNATNTAHNCDADPELETGPNGPNLVTGCANGNGPLADKVLATDGSIGYGDLATVRNKGFGITPCTAGASECTDGAGANGERDDDVFWVPVQNNVSGDPFREPTADPASITNGAKGSNCQSTTFSGIPDSTTGNWSAASGVNSTPTNSINGYGICTLTYGLVWDDNAGPYGASAAEERKARSVKDYWDSIVADSGQDILFANDYAPLPPSVLAIARAGVASVGWNKNPGGGGSNGGGGGTGGGGTGGGGGGGTTPTPTAPSNVFSVPGTTISSRNGTATFSIRLPGAGAVLLVGTANTPGGSAARRITVGRIRYTVSQAGTYRLTLKPGSAAKRVLRRKGRLRVRVAITFTPEGGTARTSTRTVTLKLRRKRR